MGNIASGLVLLGLAAQSVGLYLMYNGPEIMLLLLGSEIAALGLFGVINHARQNIRD